MTMQMQQDTEDTLWGLSAKVVEYLFLLPSWIIHYGYGLRGGNSDKKMLRGKVWKWLC